MTDPDHRATANQLAALSERLRKIVKQQRATLERIRHYCEENRAVLKDAHCLFVLGTVCNMVGQCCDGDVP